MQTIVSRILLLGLLLAVAACAATSSSHASSSVQYGIQDDTWLEFGPGTLDQRTTTFKRLGVPLVRFTLRWNEIALERLGKQFVGGSGLAVVENLDRGSDNVSARLRRRAHRAIRVQLGMGNPT